jgi:putative mRNA 3-end processing factor
MSSHSPLLTLSEAGLYCPAADVYLDPWRPVSRALITHAHSDHARPGSSYYMAHHRSVPILHHRLGTSPHQVQGVEYGESVTIRGVRFTWYPAGHVPGSAQILVEAKGERWVFSGDYKVEDDGVSSPFEPIQCNTFISECTFGLPVFRWSPQAEVFREIHAWWRSNADVGLSSILCAYSLGKAQRLLAHLDPSIGPIVVHSSIARVSEALEFDLAGIVSDPSKINLQRPVLVIAPPAVLSSNWLKRFGEYRTASVSGWMTIRGMKRRRGVDRGFVLSDHADFAGLATAIAQTRAESVHLTHGYTAEFGRWLSETRPTLQVRELGAQYNDEQGEE